MRHSHWWWLLALSLAGCGRDVPVVDPAVRLRPAAWSPAVIEAMRAIPLQHEGRIKPFDTLASFSLYAIHGRRDMQFGWGGQQDKVVLTPTEWLLDVWLFPAQAVNYPLFRIENAEVFRVLWPDKDHFQRQDLEYVSYAEMYPQRQKLSRMVEELKQKKGDEKAMEPGEQALLHLHNQFWIYSALQESIGVLQTPYVISGDALKAVFQGRETVGFGEVLQHAREIARIASEVQSKPEAERGTAPAIVDELSQMSMASMGADGDPQPGLFPPTGTPTAAEKWYSFGDLARLAMVGQLPRTAVDMLATLERAATAEDMPTREEALLSLRQQAAAAASARGEYDKVELEAKYYAWSLSYHALHWFLPGFLVVAVSWLMLRSRWLAWVGWFGFGLTAIGLGYLVGDIALRCVITSRPPIKNLYDTFLFIAAVGVLAALITELLTRRRIALSVAPLMGALLIMLARSFESMDGSDTMKPLQAVLDSNYWLATHVTMINTGYAAGMLAMLLGDVWLLLHAFRVFQNHPARLKEIARMTYGVTCFGVLVTVFGTIWGGVWANESWGRFWGWDPKENGALLICLSQIALLHARMSGLVRDFGFCLWAGVTGIAVGFSWFHVNLLGVGLHAYGFSAGLKTGVFTFYGCQLLVLLVGAVGHVLQLRPAPASGQGAASRTSDQGTPPLTAPAAK